MAGTTLKEVTCKILDAAVKEDLGTDDEPTYVSGIVLLVEDLETNMRFESFLSEEDVREILGLHRLLSTRELANFANLLRDRKEPFRLVVDMQKQVFNRDMILTTNLQSRKRRPATAVPSPSSEPRRQAYVKRFSFKNNEE